jgi:hypothetical protein
MDDKDRQPPDILRAAHRLGVGSRPYTSDPVLTILERIIGKDATSVVRAVVTAEPEPQRESGSAD